MILFSVIEAKAQIRSVKSADKEIKEYLQYFTKLHCFEQEHKGDKNAVIPCPEGTDPSLSFNGDNGNVKSWELYHKTLGNLKALHRDKSQQTIIVKEKEGDTETSNDFTDQAEVISNFGTGEGQIKNIKLSGALGPEVIQPPANIFVNEDEDNHSFSTAQNISLKGKETVKIDGSIENLTKAGTLSGDIDIYEFEVNENNSYIFSIKNITDVEESLIAVIYVGDDNEISGDFLFQDKNQIIFNSGDFSGSIRFALFSATSFTTFKLDDNDEVFPTSVSSKYEILVNEIPTVDDLDFYSIELKKGDVIGISGTRLFGTSVGLFGVEIGSFIETNVYAIRNEEGNPLPTEGDFGFHYVIPADGEHLLFLRDGIGKYDLNVSVTRPGGEQEDDLGRQIIFLNMAGANISRNDFFEGANTDMTIREFSALSSFMPNFDLDTRNDLEPLAHKITDIVSAKIDSEILEAEINPNQEVLLLSDYAEPEKRDRILDFLRLSRKPYSRLIIGGTRDDLGVRTIGLSSAIDVGNFDFSDNGIVLLDLLSSSSIFSRTSINNVPISEKANKVDLVATVIGNIAAHEAGHFLGNWHTSENSEEIGIMDKGGNPISYIAGVLEGKSFGDEDNIDVSFIVDEYSEVEGFFNGLNETDTNVAFALSTKPGQSFDNEDKFKLFLTKGQVQKNRESLLMLRNYPNPQSREENGKLLITSKKDTSLTVSIFDFQGHNLGKLYQGNLIQNNLATIEINPATLKLQAGYYLVKVVSDYGEKNHKILIY